MLALVALSFASCEKETEGVTGITYYPVITINGGEETVVKVGESYTDEGCTVTLNGEDVTEIAQTINTVDAQNMGIYTVTYSAVNEDGFSASATRNVYVVNPGNFDTIYYGETTYGTRHYTNAPVVITSLGDGEYEIDDIMGGFYWYGRYPGYEPTYDFHAEAKIKLNDDNSIELLEVGSWQFGSNEITIKSSAYDKETGEIAFVFDFGGADFSLNLTPIE